MTSTQKIQISKIPTPQNTPVIYACAKSTPWVSSNTTTTSNSLFLLLIIDSADIIPIYNYQSASGIRATQVLGQKEAFSHLGSLNRNLALPSLP